MKFTDVELPVDVTSVWLAHFSLTSSSTTGNVGMRILPNASIEQLHSYVNTINKYNGLVCR